MGRGEERGKRKRYLLETDSRDPSILRSCLLESRS